MNIKPLTLPEYSFYSRFCSAYSYVSTNFILSQTWEVGSIIISILQMKQWSTENLSNLPKVTQLITGTWLFFSASDLNHSAELSLPLHASIWCWITLFCLYICIPLQSSGCFSKEIVCFIHIFKSTGALITSWHKACVQCMFAWPCKRLKGAQGFWSVSIHAAIWNQTFDSSLKCGFKVYFLSKISKLVFWMTQSLLSQFQLWVWVRLLECSTIAKKWKQPKGLSTDE